MRLTQEQARRLPPSLKSLAAQDYDIRPAPWWARQLMRGRDALTLGSTIYMRPGLDWQGMEMLPLVAHELTHVRQWRKAGALRFAISYLWQYLWRGYLGVSYEREAYRVQYAAADELQKEMQYEV